MRTITEIEKMLYGVDPGANKCWGMTYEEGVIAALEWVLDNESEPPIDMEAE